LPYEPTSIITPTGHILSCNENKHGLPWLKIALQTVKLTKTVLEPLRKGGTQSSQEMKQAQTKWIVFYDQSDQSTTVKRGKREWERERDHFHQGSSPVWCLFQYYSDPHTVVACQWQIQSAGNFQSEHPTIMPNFILADHLLQNWSKKIHVEEDKKERSAAAETQEEN
jgi:hypothetical protein